MICLLPDIVIQNRLLNIEKCFTANRHELPLVVTTLLAERDLQQGIILSTDQDFCQDKLKDTYYAKRLSYIMAISEIVETNSPITLPCPEKLPSSQYIYTQAQIYLEAQQQELFEAAIVLAYDLDRIWERPLWRALNAQQMAEIHAAHLNWDKSLQAYERTIASFQAEPNLSPVYQAKAYGLMASAAQQAGRNSQALGYYENSIQLYPQAPLSIIQEYAAAIWQSPVVDTTGMTERVLVLAANKQGDYKFLYQLATALVDSNSADIEAAKGIVSNLETLLPASYFEVVQGTVARQESDFSTAQELFESALARGEIEDIDLQEEILSRLAIVYILDSQFGPGIKMQEQVVGFRPESSQAWHQLALFYERAGRINDAHEAIAQALMLQPDNETYLSFAEHLKISNE
jgi:tetratricopeptide (TPR) repeat protein